MNAATQRTHALCTAIMLGLSLLLPGGGVRADEAVPVSATTVERERVVRELDLTGTLRSPRRARLAPDVEGRVTALMVEAGDRVEAGDTLLRLDDELDRIELRRAEAELDETRVGLGEAERRLREARELAERNNIGRSELAERQAEVRRLEAVRNRREAERDLLAARIERHVLRAPFAGVIHRREVTLGERGGPERTALELVSTTPLHLELEIPQREYGVVVAATRAQVRFAAIPDVLMAGEIQAVVPVSAEDSRTFQARMVFANVEQRLIPGMSARVRLRIDTGRDEVVIPRDALIRYPDGRTTVWRIEAGDDGPVAREQRVRTGLAFGDRQALVEGLDPEATIVTVGNESLRDGQRVRVTATD